MIIVAPFGAASIRYIPFEVKESYGYEPPDLNGARWPAFCEYMVGIAYPPSLSSPIYGDPDAVYLSALLGRYFACKVGSVWGEAFSVLAFLPWLAGITGIECRLPPEQFKDAPSYSGGACGRPQWALRELLRRHFHPRAYISDIDLVVAHGETWPPKDLEIRG